MDMKSESDSQPAFSALPFYKPQANEIELFEYACGL